MKQGISTKIDCRHAKRMVNSDIGNFGLQSIYALQSSSKALKQIAEALFKLWMR